MKLLCHGKRRTAAGSIWLCCVCYRKYKEARASITKDHIVRCCFRFKTISEQGGIQMPGKPLHSVQSPLYYSYYVPAVGFLCLALMISRSFWRFVAGCSCFSKRQRGIVWKHSRKFVYLCILPPFTWLYLVFIDTEYYFCSKLGPLEARLNQEEVLPGLNTAYRLAEPAIVPEFQSAETESQIIAFLLLSVSCS